MGGVPQDQQRRAYITMRHHAILASLLFLCWSTLLPAETPGRTTVHPEDTGEALENPGMGWVFHHFDNSIRQYGPPLGPSYEGEGFPGLSVAYLRLAWSYLEPEDGVFDWSLIDTVAQRYIRAGRQVAFRFTCFESGDVYATPKWLKDAGVGGRWFLYGKGVVEEGTPQATWEPDYDDPLFLEKLDRFLAAAARRYDGSPHVAFVDTGSIGIWGEGNPCTRPYPLSMYKTHIDLHFKHFEKTLLVGMDDWRPRTDLRTPGVHTTAFVIREAEELRGREMHVRIGLWLPDERGKMMPEGRFLPASSRPDRRVEVGRLTLDGQGRMTFKAADLSGGETEGVDYAARVTRFQAHGKIGIFEIEWKLNRELPEGVRQFCHVGDEEKDIRRNCTLGTGRNEALDYVRQLGGTMRDDSIIYRKGFTFQSDWMAEDFWREHPVVLESGHYWSNDWSDGADQDYFDAIEAYHGSYISIHGPPNRIWKDRAEIIQKMNLRIGYRLQLVEASWPEVVTTGVPFEIRAQWRNAGVAPCYPGGFPAFTLKDSDGAIRAVLSGQKFDVRALDVGAAGKAPVSSVAETFRVPAHLPTGTYDVFVSVGDLDGTPRIALPLPDADGEKRYRLGRIRSRFDGEYCLEWEQPVKVEGEWRVPVVFETLKPLAGDVQPFGHLDFDSKIVKGFSCRLDEPLAAIRNVGRHGGYYRVSFPEEVDATGFDMYLGLWEFGGRRLLAENGDADGRVRVGVLRRDGEGKVVLLREGITTAGED